MVTIPMSTHARVSIRWCRFGVYVVSAWKKIGVEAEHKLEESASWSKSRLTRDFDLLVDPFGFAAEGDPDEVMVKFTSSGPSNWGRFKDPVVDQLFERQKVERDAQKRAQLVQDMQKRIVERAGKSSACGGHGLRCARSGCTTMNRSPATG